MLNLVVSKLTPRL